MMIKSYNEDVDNWLETKQFPLSMISAAGFVFKDGKILMVRHHKRGWSFPGGVAEQGEAVLDCLKREILEESGITAEPEHLVGVYQRLRAKAGYGPLEGSELPPVIVLTFICDYSRGEEIVSEECTDVAWFTLEQAAEAITDTNTKRMFEDMFRYEGNVIFDVFGNEKDK